MEASVLRSWLVANLRLWIFVPAFLINAAINLLAFWINPELENPSGIGMWTVIFVAFIVFIASSEYRKGIIAWYTAMLLSPVLVIIANHDLISIGSYSCLWICYLASLVIGSLPARYAYQNFNDMVSRYFRFRKSVVEQYSSKLQMAYLRYVEASFFCFVALSALASFFE